MDSVTVSFRYSQQEYTRAVRAHYASKLRVPLDLAVIGFAFAGGLYEFHSGSQGFGIFLLCAAGILSIILVAAFAVIPKLAFRQPKLRDDYSLSFSPKGIHFRTVDIDSQLQWKMYSHALINKESFLLYWGSNQFTVVPKRVFQNAAERESFEQLLANNVVRIVDKSK